MKFVAITPDSLLFNDFINSIQQLKLKGVSYLYIRTPFLFNSPYLKDAIEQLVDNGIIPVLPFERWLDFKDKTIICHFKDKNKNRLLFFLKEYPDFPFSASSHSIELAENLLDMGAEFVFISPVFNPYSKKNYNLPLLDMNKLKCLVNKYGERVALLGGIDSNRLKELKSILKCDFSVAGITFFFEGIEE